MNFCRSIIIAELRRPEVALCWKSATFCVFWTYRKKISKIPFRKNSSRHRSTCCLQSSWNMSDGKSVKSCVIYLTKKNKISPRSPATATARIASKIYQSQPQTIYSECSRFHPNRFTFGGIITECVNIIRACLKVNAIFSWSLGPSWITKQTVNTQTVN